MQFIVYSNPLAWEYSVMSDCGCFRFAPDDPLCARFGLGAAALRYAAMGYAVLPLARGAKRPHRMLGGRGGVHLATANELQLADWWSQDRTANIGVATGSVSRLAVVDLDLKHGSNGTTAFTGFLNDTALPWVGWRTATAETPSGGYHIWLRTPGGMAVPERPGILPGVDVKGDGGYVVAAPSSLLVQPMSRPGEQSSAVELPVAYRWWSGCPHEAPDAPDWMYQWLATAPAQGSPQPGHEDLPDGGATPGADELARTGIAPGYRNRVMYLTACSLFRKIGTGPDEAEVVMGKLRDIWDATDHSDFGWQEVLTIAESARRFIERSKRQDIERTRSYLAYRPPWQGPG